MQITKRTIVRPPDGPYMSVLSQDPDGLVTCGWIGEGVVQVARLPLDALKEVSAHEDEAAWIQALREQGEVLDYLRRKNEHLGAS